MVEMKKYVLLVLSVLTLTVHAQENRDSLLNIGDRAPLLYIKEWIKGDSISQMEKGHVYVVEFWATWCRPCIAAMPHLSELASQYRDNLTIIGVSVHEDKSTTVEQIREFVDNRGDKMDYHVATDDKDRMVDNWMKASEEKGIPKTFVINADGKLAWIGHPKDVDTVLQKVVGNEWDIDEALAARNERRRLDSLETDLGYYLYGLTEFGPDSMLTTLDKVVEHEPRFKGSYLIIYYTFRFLLQIDQKKAYDYGEQVLSYKDADIPYRAITEPITYYPEHFPDGLPLKAKIYRLGVKAYEGQLKSLAYPEIADMAGYYTEMANWSWRAGDKAEAIAHQEKAIEELKGSLYYFSEEYLAKLESQLQEYKENVQHLSQ